VNNNGITLAVWPRLMSLRVAALYTSIAESTWRDWVSDGIIEPVEMPGSALRGKGGRIIARPRDRRLAKILLDRRDVDRLIAERKGAS